MVSDEEHNVELVHLDGLALCLSHQLTALVALDWCRHLHVEARTFSSTYAERHILLLLMSCCGGQISPHSEIFTVFSRYCLSKHIRVMVWTGAVFSLHSSAIDVKEINGLVTQIYHTVKRAA